MSESLAIFFPIVTAIVLEAAPFLLLGSLVGALFEVFVSSSAITRMTPRGRFAQVGLGLAAGLILPTCECGVVPVVRRFMAKGVHPRTALTYMLAAPVINPVVLASTAVAFQGDLAMILSRVGMVALTAAGIGLYLGSRPPEKLLRPALAATLGHIDCEAGCGCGHHHHEASHGGSRLMAVLGHTADEFLSMGGWLVLGACAAGLFKTFMPPDVMDRVSSNPALAVAALMALAIVLSVCSEADAFVAASFAGFPAAARVAFTAVGPMVDIKLAAMFLAVFRKRVVLVLLVAPVVAVYLMSLILDLSEVAG